MRYFIDLSYKGTSYCGWQRQKDAPSVQQTIEEALTTILRSIETISVTGAGRTDTGVHASHFTAHFDSPHPIEDRKGFVYHLNAILPKDITVKALSPVKDDAHARFDALQREYTYVIVPHKDPFRLETTWQYNYPKPLDTDQMNLAAGTLLGIHEFTTFSKLHSSNKTDLCEVTHALWETMPDGSLVFTIRANRFLRNMIRAIVGTLVDVGRGKITPQEFKRRLEAKDRTLASGSAPATGLFLSAIHYPDTIYLTL